MRRRSRAQQLVADGRRRPAGSIVVAQSGEQPDHRAHLEPSGAAVGEPEHVVEEAVLFVPQLVLVVTDAVHGGGDEGEVLGELEDHVVVDRIVPAQLDGDAEHRLGVERHPRSAVRLLEAATGRQRGAAVEHADVVEAQEATFEDIAAGRVLAVDPPREVDEQLLERALQPGDVTRAPLLQLGLVHQQRRPGVHRRVDVAEVPLIGGKLPVRVEVQLPQHQLQLILGDVDVDHAQRHGVEGEVPRRVPRVLPCVRHGDHVVVDHVEPAAVAAGRDRPASRNGWAWCSSSQRSRSKK